MNKLSIKISAFAADRHAAAAVEFALLLPFLVTLLFGGIAVTDGVTARRKVAQAAGTLSDLVTQEKCVNDTFLSNTFSVAGAIIAPLAAANLGAVVSSVIVDGAGNATVAWSRPYHATARTQGTPFDLTGDLEPLKKPNTSFVVAETSFLFTPVIGIGITGPITMKDTMFALPRAAPAAMGVPYEPSGCTG
jgi:Flp pilus assembly protein TadG